MGEKAEVNVFEIDVNSLEIELKVKERRSQIHLIVNPFFNNKRITDYLGNVADNLDILYFIKSLYKDGEYFIFTCDCGNAGCGGWFVPIKVKRDNHKVTWLIDNFKAIKGAYILRFDISVVEEQKQFINDKLKEFEKLYNQKEVYFYDEHGYSLKGILDEMNELSQNIIECL